MNDQDAIRILKEFMSSDWDSAKCKEADQALTYLLSRFEELSKVPEELPEKKDDGFVGYNGDGIPEFTEEGKENRGFFSAVDLCTSIVNRLKARIKELEGNPVALPELPEGLAEFIFKWNRDSEWDKLAEGFIKDIAQAILKEYRLVKR